MIDCIDLEWQREYNKLAIPIRTLQAVLTVTAGPTVRSVAEAILSCPIKACLALLDACKSNETLELEYLSDFVEDSRYGLFVRSVRTPGTRSSVFLWSLGKRIWEGFQHHHPGIHASHCEGPQKDFKVLYETIIKSSNLDRSTCSQIVLSGFLDGRISWLLESVMCCETCSIAVIKVLLAQCTTFDRLGPHGNLLVSAWKRTMEGSNDDLSLALKEILSFGPNCFVLFSSATSWR